MNIISITASEADTESNVLSSLCLLFIDTETCSYYECFPNFEMGFTEKQEMLLMIFELQHLWIFRNYL